MTKKLFLVLLFPFIADLAISCCNCLDTLTHNYSNRTLKVTSLDNSGQDPKEISAGSVFKTAYGIRVQLFREKVVHIKKPAIVFGQSAWAFDCRCPPTDEFLPKDSVIDIRVLTLYNFNNDHPANSDVSAYFKVYAPYNFETLDAYRKYIGGAFYGESDLQLSFNMLLMTPPASGGAHQFRVQLILSDGRILEQDTPTIDLI
jgi:uncharacterized protein DUF5034